MISSRESEGLLSGRALAVWGVAGVLLLALGARNGVAALSPIAFDVTLDRPLDGFALGLLGTVPPFAYGVSGILARLLLPRVRVEMLALAVAFLSAVGHLWRGASPTFSSLFAATVLLMMAVGVVNVVLPPLVKLYAPRRVDVVTSTYTMVMSVSSTLPPALGVWMAGVWGWRLSLASWAVISVASLIPWVVLLPSSRRRFANEQHVMSQTEKPAQRLALRRSPTAWALVLLFTVSAVTAYSIFAVLPAVLVDRAGLTPELAGILLAVWSSIGIPAALVTPLLVARAGWAARLSLIAAILGSGGFVGLIFFPTTVTVVWAVATASSTLTFSMVLALIGLRTESHQAAGELSSLVNGVGYLLAAAGPLVVGAIHQATGSWTLSLALLATVSAGNVVGWFILRSEHTVEEEVRQSAH